MIELDVKYHPEKDYREMFTVSVDELMCTDDLIGITTAGELLYVKERLAGSGNAYYMEREFFSIEKEEFQQYLSIAKENGEIEKALRNGQTTEAELKKLSA